MKVGGQVWRTGDLSVLKTAKHGSKQTYENILAFIFIIREKGVLHKPARSCDNTGVRDM